MRLISNKERREGAAPTFWPGTPGLPGKPLNPGRPGLPGGPTSPGKPSTPVWKSHRSHSPCPHNKETFEEVLRRARGLTSGRGPLAPAGAAWWPGTVGPPAVSLPLSHCPLFPAFCSAFPRPPPKQNKDHRSTSSPGWPSGSAAPSTALFRSPPGSPRADPRLHGVPGRPTRSGASSAATGSHMRSRPHQAPVGHSETVWAQPQRAR